MVSQKNQALIALFHCRYLQSRYIRNKLKKSKLLGPNKINIIILLMHKVVIYTNKAISIRFIDKCVEATGVAYIPQLDKDIDLIRSIAHFSHRNIDRIRIQVLCIDASVVIHSFKMQYISTIRTHPASNEVFIFYCFML